MAKQFDDMTKAQKHRLCAVMSALSARKIVRQFKAEGRHYSFIRQAHQSKLNNMRDARRWRAEAKSAA